MLASTRISGFAFIRETGCTGIVPLEYERMFYFPVDFYVGLIDRERDRMK